MPLIAYKGAHGGNDFPLHFAFFEHLERTGVLDRYDFAIDTWHDPAYAVKLLHRFPQLKLAADESAPRRALLWMHRTVGRGYRPLSFVDTRFDAVCEGPGGRITELYCRRDLFRLYPRVKRRAIVFHSIEAGALRNEEVRRSIASCELVVTRTRRSAENATAAGARRVVPSADVVFLDHPRPVEDRPGIAVALRVPTRDVGPKYLAALGEIVDRLCAERRDVDFVLVEEPFGSRMIAAGIGTSARRGTSLLQGDAMYLPFLHRREAIVSSRLHTLLLGLLYGNRNILQFHIEPGTNKIEEILGEMGLESVKVLRADDVGWETVSAFLRAPATIPEARAAAALALCRQRTLAGMEAFEEWLGTL